MNIAIHAVNVNTGGALVLLNELLKNISNQGIIIDVYIHVKFDVEKLYRHEKINVIKKHYLLTSLFFTRNYSRILFFGNLPPFIKCKNSFLYIHNAYLVDSYEKDFNLGVLGRVKNTLLKCHIKLFKGNVSSIACQTQLMQDKFNKYYKCKILILPFYKSIKKEMLNIKYDFCFVGLPSAHKNHGFLLNCLLELSRLKVPCRVALTVPKEFRYHDILEKIKKINESETIHIDNHGFISYESVVGIYNCSNSLIFPSSLESFGLPLIEAAMLDMPIFAPDLSYVNDVVDNCHYIDIGSVSETVGVMQSYLQVPNDFTPTRLKVDNVFIDEFLYGELND